MVGLIAMNAQAEVDKEGFLVDLRDWNEAVAAQIAHAAGIELTPAHWQIISMLREFYHATGLSPSMRPLVKLVRERVGPEHGTSIHLHQLFRGSPAKVAAKIAGLPRPTNCL